MKIEWLDTAREDILTIYNWYVRKSPKAATILCAGIIDSADVLIHNPRMGHPEPLLEGLEYEFRTLMSSSRHYRIIYFIDDDTVFIFRIWDCRQKPSKLRRTTQRNL